MVPKMLVLEIVLRLLEEQANTISKVKLKKIGFRVLVWNLNSKDVINIHNLIQNWIMHKLDKLGIKHIPINHKHYTWNTNSTHKL